MPQEIRGQELTGKLCNWKHMLAPQSYGQWKEVVGRSEELKMRVQLERLCLPGTELPASPLVKAWLPFK